MDILTIGDVVTDAFVKLKDDQAQVIDDNDGELLAMKFGAKLQFEEAYLLPGVGNSANVAVSFSRLGLSTGLLSNVGDDQFGQEILDYLQQQGLDTSTIRVNKGMKTNYHYYLWYKNDRTGLIKREPYEYKLPENMPDTSWLYISAAGDDSALPFFEDVVAYLEAHPDMKLAFQPSEYHIHWGVEKIGKLYQQTNIFVANREETAQITGVDGEDIKALIQAMHELGPEIVVVTDGPDGAYASDGSTIWQMPNYPDPQPPLERTGAGDAFAAGFVGAIVKGHDIPTALQWGPINSMSVVQKVGAQEGLVTKEELEQYLADAPADYTPSEI